LAPRSALAAAAIPEKEACAMRYRLMASYHGTPYQAGVGPSTSEVTLLAAWPPPEDHGFMSSGSHWRKQVRINEIEALWESRPVGSYHGEPCLVLDDFGDRLHVAYLGMDSARASQLGYWQVDRGVFEVVIPRAEVADLAEERHEFPLTTLIAVSGGRPGLPPALPSAGAPAPQPAPPPAPPPAWVPEPTPPPAPPPAWVPEPVRGPESPWGSEPGRTQEAARGIAPEPAGVAESQASGPMRAVDPWSPAGRNEAPPAPAAWHGSPTTEENGTWLGYPGRNGSNGNGSPNGDTAPNGYARPNGYGYDPAGGPAGSGAFAPSNWDGPLSDPASTRMDLTGATPAEPMASAAPLSAPPVAEPQVTAAPQMTEQRTAMPDQDTGPLTRLSTASQPGADRSQSSTVVRGRRAARKPRVSTQSVFADLLDLAKIPRTSYAVDEEVSGAMCLVKTKSGFEVFSCADDARHEVRFFEDEEAAYFYLFGVLAAEAVRNGTLSSNDT
jgi:hypothetical protein